MMKGRSRASVKQPTLIIHHVREIQLRLLAVGGVLIAGMVVGYVFHELLFELIKAPLNAPLHYMSPAGSFTFIIKICFMAGIIIALPVAVYNVIMFAQPALSKRISRLRVYCTTLCSLLLAGGGAAFGFLVILPLALRFFYKFQVDGLEAIISADEYLRFVVGVVITFVLISQLPLLISFIDHIKPLPPKTLLKAEKYVVVGSILIAIVVPFSFDPTVQLLIASPIIVLYNLSIIVVMGQHAMRGRRAAKRASQAVASEEKAQPPVEPSVAPVPVTPIITPAPVVTVTPDPIPTPAPIEPVTVPKPRPVSRPTARRRSLDGTLPSTSKKKHLRPDLPPQSRRSLTSGRTAAGSKGFIADIRRVPQV